MRSRIVRGETRHVRHEPVAHAFRYPVFWLAIDLDELDVLDRRIFGFGVNRRRLVSVRDRDYGGAGSGTIADRVRARIAEAGLDVEIDRILMCTFPQVAGYVFRPVTFYLCDDADGRLVALVAEVRNTFGEMHHYAVATQPVDGGAAYEASFPKRFYVSPFFDTDGAYVVRVSREEESLTISVELQRGSDIVFAAVMRGTGRPFTSAGLAMTLARFPLFAATVMVRIKWQAIQLYFRRGLPVHDKPAPDHASTTSLSPRSWWVRLREAVIRRARQAPAAARSNLALPEEDTP